MGNWKGDSFLEELQGVMGLLSGKSFKIWFEWPFVRDKIMEGANLV